MTPDPHRTRSTIDALPEEDRDRLVADCRVLHLPGNVLPWTDSGIHVERGEWVSLLSAGRVYLIEALGLWGPPRFHLWAKVGEHGTIFNGTRDTFSFEAKEDGPLFLGIYQGEWASPRGDLATPPETYAAGGGAVETLLVRWKTDPRAGLEALRRRAPDDPLVASEIARLAAPIDPPEGWRYLWFLGQSEIFSATRERPGAIVVHAEGDVGILQTPVSVDLAPDTTLSWRWKVTDLPAREAEDSVPTHDYLSIAAEFDDGRDLTWYWSAALPPGTSYTCPLPTWSARETHLVVRSGRDGLGAWQTERRHLHEDFRRAIGGAPPARIVAIWLIAVSLFGHRTAAAEFADIELESGGRRWRVS